MTSRPGPGIQESLQHRGGGSAYAPARRAANPQHGQQDSTADLDRAPLEDRVTKPRYKAKPIPLEAIQTSTSEFLRPSPRGKPQLFFTNPIAVGADFSSHGQAAPCLPVPPRPGFSTPGDGFQQPRIVPGGSGVKAEAATKLQGNDAPAPALMFPGGKTADLFPWAGNHPEDVMSEALVKGGISNKSQIMNETNTARPSLWSNLKNKSGINTLSTLFVAVLEKRQSCNRLTAPNTFKPPPRLTLRDSTRETWLHDLANPTIGLRRLSRTIPHGITGKVLLEQCLNKNIPIPRAIWLAKCVGINEMRTHKRKGQAGAISWIRGWTSSVEQFLESTIATIGQQDWKPRVTYALQLTTHLFKERLLENDHFLDWALKNLDSCSHERLFIWLLIICIPDFWNDIVSARRRGKRLAESLLDHTEKFYGAQENTESMPVLSFLENVLVRLVVTMPACLLLPITWAKHSSVLHLLAERRPQIDIVNAITSLDARNERLAQPSRTSASLSNDPVGRVYQLLDSVDYSSKICIDDLSYDCLQMIYDTTQLVFTVLSWACSLYRQGCCRIYLATRLLRKWNHLGTDIYDAILACLPRLALDQTKESCAIFRIIAELVRSKTFSPGRFLQWLIATGSLSQHQDIRSPSAWPLRLVTEIPLSGLSENVQNLRNTLLRGTSYSVEMEEQAIEAAETTICHQLPGLFNINHLNSVQPGSAFKEYSSTVRLEVGAWLRQEVAASMEFMENVPTKDASVEVAGAVCMISLSDFHVVRSYLEDFEDHSILADIVGIVATTLDSNVLSAAADTLSYNLEAFRAIGAFEPLFEKIAMRYAAIRTVRFPERDLLLSLTDLARTAHADPQLMQLLMYDLSRYDQRNSLAACSPASDSMVDGITNLDVEEEIERSLSSGTSMDQQMMSRVFEKIVANLEDQLCKHSNPVENFSTWLYRLRSFEENTFEEVLSSWIKTLLLGHQTQILSTALPLLIASGSLTFNSFLKTLQECINGRRATQPEESLRIAIKGLDTLLPARHMQGSCRQQDLYRYRLEQRRFCRQQNANIINLVKTIAEVVSASQIHIKDHALLEVCSSDRLLDLLRYFAIMDAHSLSTLASFRSQASGDPPCPNFGLLFRRLLDPLGRLQLSKMSLEQQVATVVPHADYLSLPFCQLALQQIFAASASSTEEVVESVSAVFLGTIKNAIEREHSCWSELVSGLEPGLVNKIREHAERTVIDTTAFLCGPLTARTSEEMKEKQTSIRRYLSVIEATTVGTLSDVQASFIASLTERFRGLLEIFTKNVDVVGPINQVILRSKSDLCYWLNVLLRLTVIHGSAMMTHASPQHQATFMWALWSLLSHPYIEDLPSIASSVFDVAVKLSDSISDDARKHLANMSAAKAGGDARCAFMFGTSVQSDGWLNLMKPVVSPANAQTASSSLQGQLPPSSTQASSSHSMQRSSSQQNIQQSHAQSQGRAYTQYPGNSPGYKMLPQQLQRVASNGQNGQASQLQQLQQMQAMAQQRGFQAVSGQQQRPVTAAPQQTAGAKGNAAKQEKVEMRAVPFSLNRWEILPESGGNLMGNETAISLGLFGARRA
ncbi:hypothetical protein DM02DRAFT_638614 [Periconia macrospinosa]|uniref:Mediator of RNA polymerase II transcription subunit 12 n=1 Tax=Periconia macrospinosa TaxID=97972 RepID=A0A2V1EBD9_9PLEO|nr:hypothetical protein DM02DRAFT_638614 [Periconia macrospinosa]